LHKAKISPQLAHQFPAVFSGEEIVSLVRRGVYPKKAKQYVDVFENIDLETYQRDHLGSTITYGVSKGFSPRGFADLFMELDNLNRAGFLHSDNEIPLNVLKTYHSRFNDNSSINELFEANVMPRTANRFDDRFGEGSIINFVQNRVYARTANSFDIGFHVQDIISLARAGISNSRARRFDADVFYGRDIVNMIRTGTSPTDANQYLSDVREELPDIQRRYGRPIPYTTLAVDGLISGLSVNEAVTLKKSDLDFPFLRIYEGQYPYFKPSKSQLLNEAALAYMKTKGTDLGILFGEDSVVSSFKKAKQIASLAFKYHNFHDPYSQWGDHYRIGESNLIEAYKEAFKTVISSEFAEKVKAQYQEETGKTKNFDGKNFAVDFIEDYVFSRYVDKAEDLLLGRNSRTLLVVRYWALDALSEKLDEFLYLMESYIPRVNQDTLIRIMHSIRRDPEFVAREMHVGPAEAVYSLQLSNLAHFPNVIKLLSQREDQLNQIKNSDSQKEYPPVYELLRRTILPGDKIDMNVLDFLIEDIQELRAVMYQIYDDLRDFKAICALIESFPRETVVQMLDEAEEEESTPTQ